MNAKKMAAMVKTLFFLSLGLLILNAPAQSQPSHPQVVFEREHIKVMVCEAGIRVEGLYMFANNATSAQRQGLFYPFPVDSLHPDIENITVMVEGDTIGYQRVGDGVGFFIEIPARATTSFVVSYEQTSLDSSGCYILTTTAAWDRPLERAAFEIHVPGDLELEWVSYDIDSESDERGVKIYEFVREDFMPEKDLCVRWRRRAQTK